MTVAKIACPHCQRVSKLDAAKLPDRPVSFECPGCKGKVPVDPAKLRQGEEEEKAPQEPVATVSPPAAVADEEITDLPPGATFPPGMINGDGGDSTTRLSDLLAPYECTLEPLESLLDLLPLGREEMPPLLFVVIDGAAGKPPLRKLESLTGLAPTKRRKIFVTLVADDIKSLDGGAAFFYNVDLLVSSKDLDRLPSVLHAALEDHRRLKKPLFAALEQREEH